MTSDSIELQIGDGLATLWLNRDAVRNAFDEALIAAVTAALARLAADERVRVIVISGRGSAFCAGADLAWMRRLAVMPADDNRRDAERLAAMFEAIDRCPKPTVARINGACFAGGIGIVAACDVAVASARARFCFSEVRIGLVPATIGPYVLRAIGPRAASRYLLTAEVFDAPTALGLGLVHAVVPEDELDARVAAFAAKLLEGGPRAQAETKQLIRRLEGRPLDADVISETAGVIAAARAGDEGREGIASVLEKRPPSWCRPRSS